MPPNLKNFRFLLFFAINDPFETLKARNQKFYVYKFLGNIVVHIRAKYRKDQMKTEEVFLILKKVDGQTDGRTSKQMDGSADCVSSGDHNVLNDYSEN